jgi:hypothetical protein
LQVYPASSGGEGSKKAAPAQTTTQPQGAAGSSTRCSRGTAAQGAICAGWGNFQGDANAVALSAIGVFCRGCFTKGNRFRRFGRRRMVRDNADNIVGGRAGVQWT